MDLLKNVVTGTVVVVGAALAGAYYLSTSFSSPPTWKTEYRKKLEEINKEREVEKKLRFLHVLLEKTFKELYPEYQNTSPNQRITVGTMLKEKG